MCFLPCHNTHTHTHTHTHKCIWMCANASSLTFNKISPPKRLYFRKVLWFTKTKLDNANYVSLIFDQVYPDVVSGNMLPEKMLSLEYLLVG